MSGGFAATATANGTGGHCCSALSATPHYDERASFRGRRPLTALNTGICASSAWRARRDARQAPPPGHDCSSRRWIRSSSRSPRPRSRSTALASSRITSTQQRSVGNGAVRHRAGGLRRGPPARGGRRPRAGRGMKFLERLFASRAARIAVVLVWLVFGGLGGSFAQRFQNIQKTRNRRSCPAPRNRRMS